MMLRLRLRGKRTNEFLVSFKAALGDNSIFDIFHGSLHIFIDYAFFFK